MQLLTERNGAPLFKQLKNKLKGGIIDGEYQHAERLPAQTKLAKQYGVSQITVRRAIQELVQEGLLIAHSGSGTYVASTDQPRSRTSASRSIAIIFEDITGGYPLVKPLFGAIQEQCKKANYILQFVELPNLSHDISETDDMPDLDIAGAILTSPFNMPLLATIIKKNIPYVLLHNDISDGMSHSVSCNYASGIMQASLHLMEQDCRDILLITAEQERYSAGQMKLGFDLAFSAMPHVQCSREIIHAGYEEEQTYNIIRKLIADNNLPDGIILASDGMAKVALNALQQAGVSVPQEVAIVGFGNTLKAHDTAMEISAVNAHNENTGAKAMSVLQQLITGQQPTKHRFVIEPELIVRASSQRK